MRSYCAGDPLSTEVIRINGLKFNAFANLGHALKDVVAYWRKNGMKTEEEPLWADQICINQSDPDERSHQVEQMRDIYAAARMVLVALATTECDLGPADGIQWMLNLRQALRDMNCEGLADAWDSPCKDLIAAHMFKGLLHSNFQDRFVDLFYLLRSPWWQRAWIYQEFIVASEAIFLYGGASISWQDFAAVASHLQDNHLVLHQILANKVRKWAASHPETTDLALDYLEDDLYILFGHLEVSFTLVQRKYRWQEPGDLKIWLECGRMCQTSDPRDRVYAFLGLAHPHYNIVPDYSPSNTMDNVLLDVAKKIVCAENTLDLLSHVGRRYRDEFPSWVPEWRTGVLQLYRFNDRIGTIHRSEIEHPTTFIEVHGAALRVEGIRVDTIVDRLHGSKEQGLVGSRPTYCSTPRGFSPIGGFSENFGRNDCLWCFPGSSIVFVLRPVKDHWMLELTLTLSIPQGDEVGWATKVTKMIWAGDHAGLLATEGLKKEVIEIH
jgi:hypothetical protein